MLENSDSVYVTLNADFLTNIISLVDQFILDSGFGNKIKEYDVIVFLTDKNAFINSVNLEPEKNTLSLFRKHFLVKHALYSLRDYYAKNKKVFLEITPTYILLHEYSVSEDFTVTGSTENPKLAEYYLDLTNLGNETEASVTEMLTRFWRDFSSYSSITTNDVDKALFLLELEKPVTMSQLNKKYRSLVQRHHPDKGGKTEVFIQVKEAFMLVRSYLEQDNIRSSE